MKCLIQRVTEAQVKVAGVTQGIIDEGLLVFAGFEPEDNEAVLTKMAQRLCQYRVFADSEGRMNLNVSQVGGAILLVPQFTLAADTRKGLRPSFTTAATPAEGERLFDRFVQLMKQQSVPIETGVFGADMQVHLVNNGPVTFLLDSR